MAESSFPYYVLQTHASFTRGPRCDFCWFSFGLHVVDWFPFKTVRRPPRFGSPRGIFLMDISRALLGPLGIDDLGSPLRKPCGQKHPLTPPIATNWRTRNLTKLRSPTCRGSVHPNGCGCQSQWYHCGVGEFTTHSRTYFSGDWDVD